MSHSTDLLTPSSPGGVPSLSWTTKSSWLYTLRGGLPRRTAEGFYLSASTISGFPEPENLCNPDICQPQNPSLTRSETRVFGAETEW